MMGMAVTKDVAEKLEISKTDYHSMFIGAVTDWNTIGAGINTAIDKKNNVVVCGRVAGGQASHNWYYNQFPCAVNTAPGRMTDSAGYGAISFGTGDGSSAANAIGIDVTAGYTVIENSGSGDVRTCLRSAALNLPYTFQDEAGLFHRVNFDTIPPGHTSQVGWRAIGKLSLDSQVNISTSAANGGAESAWFFRPLLDGHSNGRFYSGNQSCLVGATLPAPGAIPIGGTPALGTCPNRATLRTGKYDFAAEVTIQYRTDTLNPARQAFVDAFIARVSDPAFQALWTMTLPNPPTFVPDGTNAISFARRAINQCGPLVRGMF